MSGRYQVHIAKTPHLKIDVYGVSTDYKPNGFDFESADVGQSFLKLSSFIVDEPNPRYLKFEKRISPFPPRPEPNPEEVTEKSGEMVEILHRFNGAPDKPKLQDTNANVGVPKIDVSQFQLENLAVFDLKNMNGSEPFIFQTFGNGSCTFKPGSIDDNGNDSATRIGGEEKSAGNLVGNLYQVLLPKCISDFYNSEAPTASGEVLMEDGGSSLSEEQRADVVNTKAIVNEPEDHETPSKAGQIPMALCFCIGSDLVITVILESDIEPVVEIPKITPKEIFDSMGQFETNGNSLDSIAVSELLFNVPYRELFEDEINRQRIGSDVNLLTYQRDERKHLLRSLILHRLLALGVSNTEAHNITDSWNTGYIQHRALSYRIPLIRCKTSQNKSESVFGPQPRSKPFEVLHKVEPIGFVDNFVYHAASCKGIVNSACCTLLESTFFLMIPHFKTKADKNGPFFPGAGINPAFIQNWIKLIKIAAFQLKPDDPSSVQPLVKKELKVMKNQLESLVKLTKKMKVKLQYLNDKADIFNEKMYKKVKLDTMPVELRKEIEKSEEPMNYSGFAHLQMVGFSAPDLFQNFLFMQTGKYGLFIKRTAEDPWFPYSDLNFLERRIVFLGIMDHMYSTFQVVESTLRHLEELYTPGYPMNLLQKIRPLLDLLKGDHPYQLLAEDSKVQMYALTRGVKGAISRFQFVFKELKKMIRDAHDGITKFEFTEDGSLNYKKKLGKEKDYPKINLAVPFTTYPVERFDHLKERGIAIKLSPDDEPKAQENETKA